MAIARGYISAVADEFDAAGQNPGRLPPVRKAVGGGSSFTTLPETMTEWRARKAARETPVA